MPAKKTAAPKTKPGPAAKGGRKAPAKPKAPAKGRPSLFKPDVAREIIIRMMLGKNGEGPESLRAICRDEHMPSLSTVMYWLAAVDTDRALGRPVDPERQAFLEQYTRARTAQADVLLDEIIAIADDGASDFVEKEARDGSTYLALDAEHVQRSKLRVDARLKLAQLLAPKKYGPKVQIDATNTFVDPTKDAIDRTAGFSPPGAMDDSA